MKVDHDNILKAGEQQVKLSRLRSFISKWHAWNWNVASRDCNKLLATACNGRAKQDDFQMSCFDKVHLSNSNIPKKNIVLGVRAKIFDY